MRIGFVWAPNRFPEKELFAKHDRAWWVARPCLTNTGQKYTVCSSSTVVLNEWPGRASCTRMMVCPSKAVHTLCLAVLHRAKHARASYKHARARWLSTTVLNPSTPVLVLQRHISEFLCWFSWLNAIFCSLYPLYMWYDDKYEWMMNDALSWENCTVFRVNWYANYVKLVKRSVLHFVWMLWCHGQVFWKWKRVFENETSVLRTLGILE